MKEKTSKKMNESISFVLSFIFFFLPFILFSFQMKKSEKNDLFKNSQKQNVLFVFPNNPDGIEKPSRKNPSVNFNFFENN